MRSAPPCLHETSSPPSVSMVSRVASFCRCQHVHLVAPPLLLFRLHILVPGRRLALSAIAAAPRDATSHSHLRGELEPDLAHGTHPSGRSHVFHQDAMKFQKHVSSRNRLGSASAVAGRTLSGQIGPRVIISRFLTLPVEQQFIASNSPSVDIRICLAGSPPPAKIS